MDFNFPQLQEVINMLKEISPEVWGIYMKEAQIQADIAGIWGMVFGFLVVLCLAFLILGIFKLVISERYSEDGWAFMVAVSLVGFVAFTLLAVNTLMDQYHWNANLEGRALNLLLEMLGISN